MLIFGYIPDVLDVGETVTSIYALSNNSCLNPTCTGPYTAHKTVVEFLSVTLAHLHDPSALLNSPIDATIGRSCIFIFITKFDLCTLQSRQMQCAEGNDACRVFFTTIFPLIGVLAVNILFLSPAPVIWRRYRYIRSTIDTDADNKQHNSMSTCIDNPLPLSLMFANCLAWLVYGFLLKDFYIFFANIFGATFSLWASVTCIAFDAKMQSHTTAENLQKQSTETLMIITDEGSFPTNSTNSKFSYLAKWTFPILLLAFFFNIIFAFIILVAIKDTVSYSTRSAIMGSIVVVTLCLFFVSPLATLFRVLRSRNASSFYLPFSVTQVVSGSCWALYGVFIDDPFMYAPNVFGAVVGIIQCVCIALFPSRH